MKTIPKNSHRDLKSLIASNIRSLQKMNRDPTDRWSTKFWLLPSGRVQKLDEFHYLWILHNRSLIEQELRITFPPNFPTTENPVRIAALRLGFTRLNLLRNNGELVVETMKVTDVVRAGILAVYSCYQGEIDWVTIGTLNKSGILLRQQTCKLFEFEDNEKLAQLLKLRLFANRQKWLAATARNEGAA